MYTGFMRACLHCGKELNARQKQFCSCRCHALHRGPQGRQLDLICKQCGKPFKSYRSMAKYFCSQACHFKWRTGRPSPHRRSPGSSNGIGGFRPDLGMYFRSRWEANYARMLKLLGKSFRYESQSFLVTLEDGAQSSYCPDFFVDGDGWIEIKGYWRVERRERERMEAFRQQHPEHPLLLIEARAYKALRVQYADLIPEWEHAGDPLPPKPGRKCPICGSSIISPIQKRRYCSPRCLGVSKRTPGSPHSDPRRWRS